MSTSSFDRILVIDFGSQDTQLIARRVREPGVDCEIQPFNTVTIASIKAYDPRGIIMAGGLASVVDVGTPKAPEGMFELGVPVLGICYGQQAMVDQLGGSVENSHPREFGRAFIDVQDSCVLFGDIWPLGSNDDVWMSHCDRVIDLAPSI